MGRKAKGGSGSKRERRADPAAGPAPDPGAEPLGDGPAGGDASGESAPAEEQAGLEERVAGLLEERVAGLEEEKLRLLAEFRNFRARMERDRLRIRQDALAAFVSGLLPALENLERARESARSGASPEAIVEGVDLVVRSLDDFLSRHGAATFQPEGAVFDAGSMEAMGVVPSAEVPEGSVVTVVQKGLRVGETLVLPARVLVSSGPPARGDGANEDDE